MPEAASAEETDNPPWVPRLGALLAPLGALCLWLLPLPLEPAAQRLCAIVWAVMVAWLSELIPLPVTALLIAPSLVLAGITPAKKAFAAYADPILFLFVGSFFAAKAMSRHGLDRRFASFLCDLPGLGGRAARVRFALVAGAMFLSMWISNTATTAILLPVLLGLVGQRQVSDQDRFAAGSVLALAHASTTGGLATLVGTPPNAITARLLAEAGVRISFTRWLAIGVPSALLLTLAAYLVVQLYLPAGSASIQAEPVRQRAWSRAEKVTALSFALMLVGWLVPDLASALNAPFARALAERLDPGVVALVASAPLFMVPSGSGGERVLPWRDAVQIEWGLIFLFGGGIALGEAMFQTGLAKLLGQGFIALTGVTGLWSLTAAALALAIVLTELCSNVAAVNMLVPLMMGAASELGVSAVPPALATGLGASCGFMLPVASASNALVYGTGHISPRDMMRVGLRLDLIAFAVLFVLLRLLCPLLGFD